MPLLRQGQRVRRNARGHTRSWQRFLTSGSNVAWPGVCRLARADRGRDAVRDADVVVAGELGRLGFWTGVPISVTGSAVWALCARLMCEQLIRWIGPEFPWRAYAAAGPAGASPAPSSHPLGSGLALGMKVELRTGRTTFVPRDRSAWLRLGRRWRGGPGFPPRPEQTYRSPPADHPRVGGPAGGRSCREPFDP
jgi:hypothetical protein